MAGQELPPQITALLGKEITFSAHEEVGRAGIRKFALAMGDNNPLYLEEGFASTTRFGGIIAPPTFVCETWQYLAGDVDEDGGPVQKVLVDPGGRRHRGGNEYKFLQPLRPDDTITATWRMAEAYWREGRSGRLLFVITDINYTNQRQELLATNRETFIFQFPT
ncbi:MAG: MaoC family dehydratase N-terminal domain-containing protein [Dehalococcoidia bacterium]|jgi:acyl dehydratase|nr:MaoC family dehydratase N-terminal domain-containing protein [Dehalococcoidia bacterium]